MYEIIFTTGQTTASIDITGFKAPITVTLKSEDATRKIEFSTDGGIEYFEPVFDQTSDTMLVTSALTRITHVKATGVVGDKLIILGE